MADFFRGYSPPALIDTGVSLLSNRRPGGRAASGDDGNPLVWGLAAASQTATNAMGRCPVFNIGVKGLLLAQICHNPLQHGG